jgi:hypothetical protein
MSHAERNQVLCSGRGEVGQVDKSLESLVRAELLKSPYPPIRAVSCRLNVGVLTLRGSVPSYYLKQVAQRLAIAVIADRVAIENQLQVER